MRLDKIIERWLLILKLVHQNTTGEPVVFAERLGISTVTLYKDIKCLNIIISSGLLVTAEVPIKYDAARKTYTFIK